MSYLQARDSSFRPHTGQDWDVGELQPPVSPVSASASLTSLRQAQYGQQVGAGQIRAPNRSVSPIKERYYSQMPPPPRRDGQPYTPASYRPQRHQEAPYMPTASDFSPPDPERRALNDIDNIFGPRELMSPSPEPEDLRSYVQPRNPSTPPRQNRRPKTHQQTNSASSMAPLMSYDQSSPATESPSPIRKYRNGQPYPVDGGRQGMTPSPTRGHRSQLSTATTDSQRPSPSPTRKHRGTTAAAPMGQPKPYIPPPEPSPYDQYDDDYPETPPRQGSRPNMNRNASNVPLMESRASMSSRGPPSPTRRSHGAPAAAAGAVGASAATMGGAELYRDQVPRRWQGDDYDSFDPSSIADDDDDGFNDRPRSKKSRRGLAAAAGIGGGAAAEEASKGGFKVFEVRRGNEENGYGDGPPRRRSDPEKSEWLDKQNNGSKRLKWIVGSLILLVVIAAVVGGTAGGILGMKNSNANGSSTSPASSGSSSGNDKGGLYDIDSSEIKALLDNDAFHKIFPGMDYTPLNAQYPDCIHNPPSQNNITMDIAQLAQLTPAVRLYGTDCNQTEMVLEAISRLGYNDTLQVWLGVWLGSNATTNDRQLSQMETLLRTYPSKHFAGIIAGNEVLFRKDMTESSLASNLSSVRQTLSDLDIDLPVATSDLGDDWTSELAADSDIVMANVHPFFAGVTPDKAAGWTWDFWQNHNVGFKTAASSEGKGWPNSIVSEVGWPSDGGTNCGGKDGSCSGGETGAVAGIDELNEFMEGWVCESLKNGTTFFWFEAFDEPWKKSFDTETQKWESKWGLMDENRNVKDGLKIPDCGGVTVDKPY